MPLLCNNIINFFSNPNLWQDLFTTTIGAFIGFLGAYFIFNKGIKSDNRKEDEKQKSQQRDNLKYFEALLSNVIKIAKAQTENFKDYSEKIKTEPFKHQLLNRVTNHDLKRATEKLDIETYYLAYISQLGNDKETVQEFKKIVTYFDYVDAVNDDALKVLQGKLEIIYKKKLRFKELFEKSLNDAGQTMFIDHLRNDSNLISFIGKRFTDYYEYRQIKEDFETPKNRFIEPLLTFLTDNDYLHDPFLNQLFFQLKECMFTYNSIIFDITDLSENFDEFSGQMNEGYENLTTISKHLIDGMNKSS